MAFRNLTPQPETPMAVLVQEECARRLAAGFDYDFGDARGVHRIGTTERDMAGWKEVTDVANAAINLGNPSLEIAIATDTGIATVTAMEWQAILVAAAQFRQPIWAASFALQAMESVPANYADESYWAAL